MITDNCKYTAGFQARIKGLTEEQANAVELYAIDYVTTNETRVISHVMSYDGENHEIQFEVLLFVIAYNQSNIEDEKACAEAYRKCLEEWNRLRYQIINVIKGVSN